MQTPSATLIQFSDLHITPAGQTITGGVDTLANITTALTEIESMVEPVAGLIFSGDLADKGDLASYQRLRATVEPFAARMNVPAIYAMGNHDERAAFRAGLLGVGPSVDNYDHVVWLNDLRVIVLDSTVHGHHHGEIDDAQLAWLAAELATPAPAGSVLVLHHPPISTPIDLEGITLAEPRRLAAALAGSDVRIILCGHAHHSSAGALAGIPVWMAGATAYRLDALTSNLRAVPGGVYTRIDLFPDTALATDLPIGQRDEVLYEYSAGQLAAMIAAHQSTLPTALTRNA